MSEIESYQPGTVDLTLPGTPVLPALAVRLGKRGLRRFLEFFTVNIRNRNTREAYGRAAGAFLRWCEDRGIREMAEIQPIHVASYIESLQGQYSKPTIKQHLACLRMMFDWLVVGQIVPSNPARSVREPKHSVSVGVTPVLSAEEARVLLDSIDTSSVIGLRDCALIAVMIYSFARIEATVSLTAEDFYPERRRYWIRLNEKGGKVNKMPCHHNLETYLHEYIEAAGLQPYPKTPLFRFRAEHRPPRGAGVKRDSHPEEAALIEAAPEIAPYISELKRKGRKVAALALRQMLRLLREYPREPFLAAVAEAARYGFTISTVWSG